MNDQVTMTQSELEELIMTSIRIGRMDANNELDTGAWSMNDTELMKMVIALFNDWRTKVSFEDYLHGAINTKKKRKR